MEILIPLQEVLDCVKTPVRGYDLERVTLAVIRSLSRMPEVVAIFIDVEDRSNMIGFTVVTQGFRGGWDKILSLSAKMDQRMKLLQRRYHPLKAYFSWELWPRWRRQDGFGGDIRVWLRPKKHKVAA